MTTTREDTFEIIKKYVNSHQLTDEEFDNVVEVMSLAFGLSLSDNDATLMATIMKTLFNLGYEAGQKSVKK